MESISDKQHALYMFTRTFKKYNNQSFINIHTFSDGIPFIEMLSSISYFSLLQNQLEENSEKWTQKLSNLKKLINSMENYVLHQSQKSLKVSDVELVEIAKNNSQEQVLKFFEIVIAVLMQTPQKQDYIQTIMNLDERSQQALVIVVQNAMQYRISDQQQSQGNRPLIDRVQHLQNQNHILNEEINQLYLENENLTKINRQLKDKLLNYEEQIEKAKNLNIEMYMNSKNEDQKQKNLIETLKIKMIALSREHEIQLAKQSQDIYLLKSKLIQTQEESIERSKLLQQRLKTQTQNNEVVIKRQDKLLQQKQSKLKKLQYELQISRTKGRQLSELIQVNDLTLRMQLQKKEVRFKQLQRQVKHRLIEPGEVSSRKLIIQDKNESEKQELQYLKIQVQKLRTANRQLQREGLKLKKKVEKVQAVQNDKKKLEKMILDISKCRDSEIEMLVVSLYDLRNENIRMHEIISQLKKDQEIQ